MKFVGIVIILIGIVDFVGSYVGFDLWGGFFGIQLPEAIWKFSAYIEIALGYFIMKLGAGGGEEEATPEAQPEAATDTE